MGRLAGKVGFPISTDSMTAAKARISYARVLVDVDTIKELVEVISFKGPDGQLKTQEVVYEWLPCKCSRCGLWGHKLKDCKKAVQQKQIWVKKALPNASEAVVLEAGSSQEISASDEGF